MSETRNVLDRVASHVPNPDDPFDRLTRRRVRRHRNRRAVTIVLALAVAVGGSLGAFAAFRGTTSPQQITAGTPKHFLALWPESDPNLAKQEQDRVDRGFDRWRLSPETVAIRFANQVLGWSEVDSAPTTGPAASHPCRSDRAHCRNVGPNEVIRPIYLLGTGLNLTVRLQRLVQPASGGIWSVTEVEGSTLRLNLRPDSRVHSSEIVKAITTRPDHSRVTAGVAWGICQSTIASSAAVPAIAHSGTVSFKLRVFHPSPQCPSRRTAYGYVFFLWGEPKGALGSFGFGMFGSSFARKDLGLNSVHIYDMAVIPVRISLSR
jgi:hypothetical protein